MKILCDATFEDSTVKWNVEYPKSHPSFNSVDLTIAFVTLSNAIYVLR